MIAYVARRLAHSLPVLVGITIVAFLLVRLIPGDPVQVMLGMHATPDRVAQLREQLHLDQPLPTQYLSFLTGAISLDFGDSIAMKSAITPILGGRIMVTVWLLAYSVLISLLVAVPLAGSRRYGATAFRTTRSASSPP